MIANQQKLVTLWVLMVICMILHFNYNVSGIFYGVDVAVQGADGTVPFRLVIIRLLFNIIPMIFAAATLFFAQKWFRLATLIFSGLYVLAHAFHLLETVKETPLDPSQLQLLGFTFAISLVQAWVSLKWWREPV
jgi:hypothetical protein